MFKIKIEKDLLGTNFIKAYEGRQGDESAERIRRDPFRRAYSGKFQRALRDMGRTISGGDFTVGRGYDFVLWKSLAEKIYHQRMNFYRSQLAKVFPRKHTFGLGRKNPWESNPHDRALGKGKGPFFRVEQQGLKYTPWRNSLTIEKPYRTQARNIEPYQIGSDPEDTRGVVVLRGRLQSNANHAEILLKGRRSFIMPNTTFRLDKDRTVWMVFAGRNGKPVFVAAPPLASRFSYIKQAAKQSRKHSKKDPSLEGIQGSFIKQPSYGPNTKLKNAFILLGLDNNSAVSDYEVNIRTERLIRQEAGREISSYFRKYLGAL